MIDWFIRIKLLFDTAGFLAGWLSSESLLLLEGAGRLAGCWIGVDVDGLLNVGAIFFFLSSSSLDESESDELSFFFAGACTTFLLAGVTGAEKRTNRLCKV